MLINPKTATRDQLLSHANLTRVSKAIARKTTSNKDARTPIIIRVQQTKKLVSYDDSKVRVIEPVVTRELHWQSLGEDVFLTSDGHLAILLPEEEWRTTRPVGTYVSIDDLSAGQIGTATAEVRGLMVKYHLSVIV